ncbi:porin family protein [Roseivirga echinicomitans]|uniref:Outer membrane protein beta-barrel domain-containing protein n=1 Tax=Roseivirga echinicomitans TaxID=296218 RepID=A0A150WZ37_9BACT|nr:PorT family protein [Roseivirga echinicomitans]KYG71552.1 hypothetical protein AWN68_12470 [Roseivirga echinicomitans]
MKINKMIFRGWLVIFILFVSFSSCFGQDIYAISYKAGPVFKVVSSRVKMDSDFARIPDNGNEIGYQFGFFTKFRVNNVYFQPEFLIANTQNKIELLNYNGENGFNPIADFEFTTLEVPFVIGLNIGNLRLDAGPSFSFIVTGNEYFLNEKYNVTQDYHQTSMFFRFGLGVDINRLLFDFKFESGLSKTEESIFRVVGRERILGKSQLVFSLAYSVVRD